MTALYLDVDGPVPESFGDFVVWACKVWRWPLEAVRYDRTAHGWHIVVYVRRVVCPALVVAAQAVLGSDVKREVYNLMRVQSLGSVSPFWRSRWNVLYDRHSRPGRQR